MLQYVSAEVLGTAKNGRYRVSIELLPWGTKVVQFGVKE
jgi:hypothetical protein